MPYKFSITGSIAKNLQAIERVRERVRHVILPPVLAEQLRVEAQLRSTHYSTRIEGNRLTLHETEQAVQQGRLFPGRERDVAEVERYYQALQRMEQWVAQGQGITEQRIRKVHALIFKGGRSRATKYRDGQNVIRDSGGGIVYLPPEAEDVPQLMNELVFWITEGEKEYPIPLVAGIAHYQFETIHPFNDGNGRTGRMLTTWLLYQGGYDLGKFYALEEFYAQDLDGYYNALVTHPHHNYYFGRDKADITPWLEYFINGMTVVFEKVEAQVSDFVNARPDSEKQEILRGLDHRARRVLGLFSDTKYIKSSQVANLLGLSHRRARALISDWVDQGLLEVADPSRRGRKYGLAKAYLQLVSPASPTDRGL